MMTLSSLIVLRQHRVWRGRRAFTLVELMVAVALVLVLIIGVNEVFRLTSNTINVGQSLSTATRDQRAVRTTLEDDFKHMAPDGPCIIISNKAVAAFRSREDELSQSTLLDAAGTNVGADPRYQDVNGDGYAVRPGTTPPTGTQFIGGEYASPAVPTGRIRRTDTITFFVRKPGMQRQTADYGSTLDSGVPIATDVVGSTTASEAMITYGHLRLPDNASTWSSAAYFEPGEPDKTTGSRRNDNNRYYTQWVLGRSAMLLQPESQLSAGETFFRGPTAVGSPRRLNPLSQRTNAGVGTTGVVTEVGSFNSAVPPVFTAISGLKRGPYDAFVDVAGTSIPAFSRQLADYIRDYTYNSANYPANVARNNGMWFLPASSDSYSDTYNETTGTGTVRETLAYRSNGNPFGARGYSGTSSHNDLPLQLSQTAPVFVPRCTNFIVEFAGDYVTQVSDSTSTLRDPQSYKYGVATKPVPDGEIDFTVFHGVRRIRWYGLPRYDNSGNVTQPNTSGAYYGPMVCGRTGVQQTSLNNVDHITLGDNPPTATPDMSDTAPNVSEVVPVSDLLCDAQGTTAACYNRTPPAGGVASFEKVIMTDATVQTTGTFFDIDAANSARNYLASLHPDHTLPVQLNYADTSVTSTTNEFSLRRANYVCAWQGNDQRPKLIRITMTLEDPNSRTGASQTYEYVFAVPQ